MSTTFGSTGQQPGIYGGLGDRRKSSWKKYGKMLWAPGQLCLPSLCHSPQIFIHLDINSPFILKETEAIGLALGRLLGQELGQELEIPPVSCSLPTDLSSAPAASLQAQKRGCPCLCPCPNCDLPPVLRALLSASPGTVPLIVPSIFQISSLLFSNYLFFLSLFSNYYSS